MDTLTEKQYQGKAGWLVTWTEAGTTYTIWLARESAAVRLREAIDAGRDVWSAYLTIVAPKRSLKHLSAAGLKSWAGLTPKQRAARVRKIQRARKANREKRLKEQTQ